MTQAEIEARIFDEEVDCVAASLVKSGLQYWTAIRWAQRIVQNRRFANHRQRFGKRSISDFIAEMQVQS